jgi:3-methyladenine DNA glycosylase/8-oxoguanine DNA glycosylase
MELLDDPRGEIAQALDELATRSEVLANLIERQGPYEPRRSSRPDVFGSLARAIIFQQLAGKAASSIHRRFADLFDGSVTSEKVLAADPELIRSAGLSGAKRDAVIDLARHGREGLLDLPMLESLDDEALTRSLCRVRGIGPWTAQMFLLFELGRLDVWPTGDLAVRKGFGVAFDRPVAPTARELEPMGDPYRPYRSIVAWYCWRVLDTITPPPASPGGR